MRQARSQFCELRGETSNTLKHKLKKFQMERKALKDTEWCDKRMTCVSGGGWRVVLSSDWVVREGSLGKSLSWNLKDGGNRAQKWIHVCTINWSSTGYQKYTMEKGSFSQQTMLAKLDTRMWKSETAPLSYTKHRGQLKMDWRLKSMTWNCKTIWRKHKAKAS